MEIIELFFITNIILLFIITVYYTFFKFKDKNKNLYLIITILLMIFMILYLYNKYNINSYLCFITIPIILLLREKKLKLSILLSLIEYIYCYKVLMINSYFLLFLLLSYYIIYYIFINYSKSCSYLTNAFVIDSSIFILMYLKSFDIMTYKNLIVFILYILSIYLIIFYIKRLRNTMRLNLKRINVNEFTSALYKASCEIKNPLTVIKACIEEFNNNDIPKECEEYRDMISDEVDNIVSLLDNLSVVYNLSIKKDKMNFNNLLNEIKEYKFKNKKIKLNINSDTNIKINADYNKLREAIINILNFLITKDSIIDINTSIAKDNLIIVIKDSGHVLEDNILNDSFKPFYGLSFDLYLAKEIIILHDGLIECDCIKNKYTEIKIVIPTK